MKVKRCVKIERSYTKSTMVFKSGVAVPVVLVVTTTKTTTIKPKPRVKLPLGWLARVSRNTGMVYYVNTCDNSKQWTKPDRPAFCNFRQIRCIHILVKHAGSVNPFSWRGIGVTRTKQEAIMLIKGSRDKIVNGINTIQELAHYLSDCPTSIRGGDLGYFMPGKMLKAFDDVAFKLAIGELSKPVDTLHGIHLILRTE